MGVGSAGACMRIVERNVSSLRKGSKERFDRRRERDKKGSEKVAFSDAAPPSVTCVSCSAEVLSFDAFCSAEGHLCAACANPNDLDDIAIDSLRIGLWRSATGALAGIVGAALCALGFYDPAVGIFLGLFIGLPLVVWSLVGGFFRLRIVSAVLAEAARTDDKGWDILMIEKVRISVGGMSALTALVSMAYAFGSG
jgi:hypothetical protein